MAKNALTLPKSINLADPTVKAVLAGLGIFLLYQVLRTKAAPGTIADAEKESKEISKTQYPTFSPTQYQLFADKIYMAGVSWFGTDEEAIYNVFRAMKNDLDILELIKAFGTKRLEFTTVQGNLSQFLYSEFGNKEIGQLNNILQTAAIKYRF